MLARVYILADLVHADSTKVARTLWGKPGIVELDVLDGPPSIMMVIEAPEKLKAGEYLVDILDSVECMTENLRVLPVDKSIVKSTVKNRLWKTQSRRGIEERRDKKSCLSVS